MRLPYVVTEMLHRELAVKPVVSFGYYQLAFITMEITSITVVYADGSIVTTSGPFAPVIPPPALPSPEDVEIDVVLSDGSTKGHADRSKCAGILAHVITAAAIDNAREFKAYIRISEQELLEDD